MFLKQTGLVLPLLLLLAVPQALAVDDWPALPKTDATVSIPAQSWPVQPGPRTVKVKIFYPGGSIDQVNSETGLMLTLHNWGGTGSTGTADPATLVKRYNVVAITVDYLQSGPNWKSLGPYDFGFYQGLDALRALYFVFDGLGEAGQPFDRGRIFATGGSGGGNVTLMVNKLAPRTFTCCVDMCGMNGLTDDMAFGNPEKTGLNARYSRDPNHPFFLKKADQTIRIVGDPNHLRTMKTLGNRCKMIVVHGTQDDYCPVEDAKKMVENFQAAGLGVEAHFITPADVDGQTVKTPGHALGNRTQIVDRFGGVYLYPNRSTSLRRAYLCDFQCRDEAVRYPVPGGVFIISYQKGYPIARFEKD